MLLMIHRLERKSETAKLPLTVKSHVRHNISKDRDIKSASDMALSWQGLLRQVKGSQASILLIRLKNHTRP